MIVKSFLNNFGSYEIGPESFAYHMQLGPNSFEFAKGKYLAYSEI